MAAILAMGFGSFFSGLLGPLLGMIPDAPGSSVTNPFRGLTSTGGNSVMGPLAGLITGGGSSGSSGSSSSTSSSGSGSGGIMSDPNTPLYIGGALLVVLIATR